VQFLVFAQKPPANIAAPSNGTTTASSTVVDASGNVYMLGNATGDLGSQLNQGEQDAYLTKYDSAGTVLWSKLVGSAGTADGAAMVQEAMDRLMPDLNGDGLARADLVIEAIIEKVEAKRELFAQIEARAPRTALLASNTSSIPLEDIAKSLQDPTRLVGLHFFNPVAQMQLVEIVRGALRAAQSEMEALIERTAMSPFIRASLESTTRFRPARFAA